MIVKKCDICGAEMRVTAPRYKVTFNGWLYTKEKDICIDCFKRIADEIKQADTPQTETHDLHTETHECVSDTPQTDCPYDEDDKCFGCGDDTKCVVFDTPQTDCQW